MKFTRAHDLLIEGIIDDGQAHHVPTVDDKPGGRTPGGFLKAVLANDLAQAVGRADPENLAALKEIVGVVWNDLPLGAWGSYGKVAAWLAERVDKRTSFYDGFTFRRER